jgi:hypothetical protein
MKLRHVAAAAVAVMAAGCSTDLPVQPAVPPHSIEAITEPASSVVNSDAAQNQLLAGIRAATAAYHSIDAAIADGYVQGSVCEAMPGQGIGIHYRKQSLVDQVVDPAHPELLVYEPRANGDLRLVSVAFLVPAIPWDATHTIPPLLGDQVFEDKRVPDWTSPPFPTYELHVWVWRHNSNGIYATTNPAVRCDESFH